ncbi:phage baseplate assembly protein V [Desulfogranum marinum]|uniref:phage baseplate assembly protein V n=1 Tax=Desulfogranum marinum TaxID=453220 RepID=UPI0029C82C95|nr:phage baseplate assembly protein V [Desulfogranum marinum]
MIHDFTPDGGRQLYYGVYPAIVTDVVDPETLGRVEVKFPWLGTDGDNHVRAWATLVSNYADDDQGFQALPEVDSQVVVAFEAGNLRRPYIIGACWNGQESMPVAPEAANNKRVIRTRSKSILEFDDTQGAAKITLSLESGHKLVLDDAGQTVTLTHSNGSVLRFTASGQIEIQANATVELTAAALNVHVPVATFDGIVNCTTLNASIGVISPMYTPGAGNVW